MSKIYDCFPFFNELEVLEIRLETMYDYVDYFIISECDYTFSGLKKGFIFEENKERFSKYLDKIIHIKNENTDEFVNLVNNYDGKRKDIYQNIINRLDRMRVSAETDFGKGHWCRDYLHKELVMLGMDVCEDDDIIIFGDLDEIPNPEKLKFDGGKYLVNQKNMMYYINTENISERWCGTYICKFSDIMDNSCMFTREKRFMFEIVENAGWHLSFMGGSDRIIQKIQSYGHQEYNNSSVLSQVSQKMAMNSDILNRGIQILNINLSEYYPAKILDLVSEKFNYLINE